VLESDHTRMGSFSAGADRTGSLPACGWRPMPAGAALRSGGTSNRPLLTIRKLSVARSSDGKPSTRKRVPSSETHATVARSPSGHSIVSPGSKLGIDRVPCPTHRRPSGCCRREYHGSTISRMTHVARNLNDAQTRLHKRLYAEGARDAVLTALRAVYLAAAGRDPSATYLDSAAPVSLVEDQAFEDRNAASERFAEAFAEAARFSFRPHSR